MFNDFKTIVKGIAILSIEWGSKCFKIQSTLVISASLISNNPLSQSDILVPVLTWNSNNR